MPDRGPDRARVRLARYRGFPEHAKYYCFGGGRKATGKDWVECCLAKRTDMTRAEAVGAMMTLIRCDGCGDWSNCVAVEIDE